MYHKSSGINPINPHQARTTFPVRRSLLISLLLQCSTLQYLLIRCSTALLHVGDNLAVDTDPGPAVTIEFLGLPDVKVEWERPGKALVVIS
jgi:hypothetical protein